MCLKHFSSKKAFNSMNHKCNYKNRDEMPENMAIVNNKLMKCPLNAYIKPFHLKHTFHLPWVMYCDFESLLINSGDEKHSDKQQHKLSSFYYNLVCRERTEFNRFKIYRGTENDSVIDIFLNDVKNILKYFKECKKKFYALPMLADEELKKHKKIKNCEFCGVKFDKEIRRIQHHNHINAKHIATTCKPCNSKTKCNYNTLYIIFHYLKGYDIHYIIEKLNDHFKDSNINLISNNSSSIFHVGIQNYIKIIDSHEFIPASLRDLSNNLKHEDIHYTREMLDKYGQEFIQKDIYPFRYIDNFQKFNEKTFLDIKYFNNVDQKTYEKYRKFFYTYFNTIDEYSDYYLQKDVTLMSDVMESYRGLFMHKYKRELFSHYSINSFAWELLKRWNPVQIKLLDNYKIYSAFQSMMRGGLCDSSTRYAIANNKYMKNYDHSQKSIYIMHFDINSMYGHIMRSYPLPYDEFSFLTNEEIRDFNIWDYDINSEYGYILNIDISEIDIKHHDYYNDLPIFPYKRKILKKEISDYQKEI